MPDLTLDTSLVGANRQKAQIELNFMATPGSTTYEVVPGLVMLDPYAPNTTVKRDPLFLGAAGGVARDQVTARLGLGSQAFQSTTQLGNSTMAKMLAKTSATDPYNGQLLARYTDGLGTVTQGQALLVNKGEVGSGVEDTTKYAWGLEWIIAQTTPLYVPAPGGVTFSPSTAYTLNQKVNPTNTATYPYQYNVTTAGTAAGTEPTWPTTPGGTITSGTVTFTRV